MKVINAQDVLDVITEAKVVKDADALIADLSLSEQGIDSLDFSGLLLSLEESFEVEFLDDDIDDLQTINEIVEYINKKK